MQKCMFCDREHKELFGDEIKYCEFCKQEMDKISVQVQVSRIINDRKEELKNKKLK